MQAGLYDSKNNLIKTWEELEKYGLKVDKKTRYGHNEEVLAKNELHGKLVLPNTIKKISAGAFLGCKWIKEIVIPSSVKFIGEMAFMDSDLEKIQFSEGLKEICNNAFSFSKLKGDIYLPFSLEKIEKDVFAFCRALEKIYIPNDVINANKHILLQKDLTAEIIPNESSLDILIESGMNFKEINKKYMDYQLNR